MDVNDHGLKPAAADFSLSAKSGPQIGSPICRFREDCGRASGGKRFAQAKRCPFLAGAKKREATTFPVRLALLPLPKGR
ncbi:hypothetical protein J4441_01580 [Candidatus Micrarchaeota archaeon]|nr:hypothetical protein [Candidatus Micrarchaeota archaeon]